MRVACAVIENGGKFLLAQRPPEKENGLRWEFPGGKIEDGESAEQALVREIKEELHLDIRVGERIGVFTHAYAHGTIELHAFQCGLHSRDVKLNDTHAIAWVAPHEFAAYDITEADLPIVEKLKGS